MKFEYIYGQNVEHLYPGVSISIERVTPELADKWLETNVENRDAKREPIARSIENGEWELNGSTIVWSDDGVLRDGANRLRAIKKAGKAVDTVVVRGVKASSQMTMDNGVKRQVADFLKMLGYKNCTAMAAAGSALLRADMRGIRNSTNKPNGDATTMKETVSYCVDHDERIIELLSMTEKIRKKYKGVTGSTLVVLFDRFDKASAEDAEEFASQLMGYTNQSQPVQKLADALFKNSLKKEGRFSQRYIAALFVKVWNKYLMGETIQLLTFKAGGKSPEEFPSVMTPEGSTIDVAFD